MRTHGWVRATTSLLFSVAAFSQTATVQGSLAAFDVINDTGVEAHGFEIQLEGAVPGDLYYALSGQRYGMPVIEPYATGVYVRYRASYNSSTGAYSASTPKYTPGTPVSWNDCYQAGSRYASSGCEHFGQSLRATQPGQISKVTGRWLIDNPAAPGTLMPSNPPAAIPFPTWFVSPPVIISAPPVVVAEIEAPEPPEAPEKYGPAQWIKIYRTTLNRPVTVEELSSDNPSVVPEDPTQIEVSWDIIQADPPAGGNGNRTRSRKQNQGNIGADVRAIIRRYEFYKYTGAVDAITNKVSCADGTCTAPSPGELGDALTAQNSAVNVIPDSIQVTRDGPGTISGANVNCGNACSAFAPKGSLQTLTANPGGNVFIGWSGACSGVSLSCAFNVNGATAVGATFKKQFTLSVGRSNSGTVTGTPNGNDRQLNCGGNCSAKFTDGTAVTLTAVPPAGKSFVNWAGGCSGTSQVCVVTISKDTSVQAVFSK